MSAKHRNESRKHIAALLLKEFLTERSTTDPKAKTDYVPYLDRWLAARFKKDKRFGKRDRAYYSETLFHFWRHSYAVAFSLSEKTPQQFLKSAPTANAVLSLLKENAHKDLLAIAASLSPENLRKDEDSRLIAAGIPLWFKPALLRRKEASQWTSDQFTSFLAAQLLQPPLWIRWQYLDRKAVALKEFSENNIHILLSPHEHCAAIQSRKSLHELSAFRQGMFEIQDFASQELGDALDVHPGNFIWDVCAGAGGKSMQIASRLDGKGVVLATDIRAKSLEELKRRATRSRFYNIRSFVHDATQPLALPKEIQRAGGFDRILIDAPCSGSGTWRRNPDLRYRHAFLSDSKAAPDLAEQMALQEKILHAVTPHLMPGGTLVYATCSVWVEENEDQVQNFLNAHKDFILLEQRLVGSPDQDSDSMFFAKLRRKPI